MSENEETQEPTTTETPEKPEILDPEEPTGDQESSDADDLFLAPDESEGEVVDVEAEAAAEVIDIGGEAPAAGEEDAAGGELEALAAEIQAAKARVAELEEALGAVERERDDFKSRLLRSAADMENFRKRKEREQEETRKYGSDKLVSDLLPAVDNLERALDHAEKSNEESSIADGVKMVYKQLQSSLEKHGIVGFESVGERFDPQRHEAIQQVDSTEFDTGTVVQVFQKGYFIHDRLLRPAMTVVARRVDPPTPAEPEVEAEEPSAEPAQTLEESGSEAASEA